MMTDIPHWGPLLLRAAGVVASLETLGLQAGKFIDQQHDGNNPFDELPELVPFDWQWLSVPYDITDVILPLNEYQISATGHV